MGYNRYSSLSCNLNVTLRPYKGVKYHSENPTVDLFSIWFLKRKMLFFWHLLIDRVTFYLALSWNHFSIVYSFQILLLYGAIDLAVGTCLCILSFKHPLLVYCVYKMFFFVLDRYKWFYLLLSFVVFRPSISRIYFHWYWSKETVGCWNLFPNNQQKAKNSEKKCWPLLWRRGEY